MVDVTKYQPATLPLNGTVAVHMAQDREEWAKEARARDQYGSAREFELTALLLRKFNAQQSALVGLVKAFVNPADGGEYETGEIPALDAARDEILPTAADVRGILKD